MVHLLLSPPCQDSSFIRASENPACFPSPIHDSIWSGWINWWSDGGQGGGVQWPWLREDRCWLGVSLPFTPILATLLTLVSGLLLEVCSDKMLSLTSGPSQIRGRKGSTLGTWLLEGHSSFCADTSLPMPFTCFRSPWPKCQGWWCLEIQD